MAALNFPDPNVTQDYVHTDNQGTVVEYKWNATKGLWQAVSVTGYSFPEAPEDGKDYVRNSKSWEQADYFSGDYSDLANTPDIPTDNSELTNGAGYATETWVEGKGYITDAGVTEITAGANISVDQSTGNVTISSTASGGGVTVDSTPPALVDSTEGDLYWNTNDGQLYIAYSDADTDQWVPASPSVKGDKGDKGEDGTDGGVVAQVNADWDADSGVAQILNKPTIEAGGWVVPAGTRMIFDQATVPTGWTLASDKDNHALRVVSSSGGSTGGSTDFTTAFKSHTISFSGSGGTSSDRQNATYTCNSASFSVNGTTDSYLASGSVSVGISNHSLSGGQNGSHDHRYISTTSAKTNIGGGTNYNLQSYLTTDPSGSGSGHSHSASATFYGSAHSHDLNFTRSVTPTVPIDYTHDHGSVSFSGSGTVDNAVKYTNVCIGVKS